MYSHLSPEDRATLKSQYLVNQLLLRYIGPAVITTAAVGIGARALTRKRGGLRKRKYTRRSKHRSG